MTGGSEQVTRPDHLETIGVEVDGDPDLAAYYRDLAEVNEAIANLYQHEPTPDRGTKAGGT